MYVEQHFHTCVQQSINKYCLKEKFHMQGSLENIRLNKITYLCIEGLLEAFNMSRHVVNFQESGLVFKIY